MRIPSQRSPCNQAVFLTSRGFRPLPLLAEISPAWAQRLLLLPSLPFCQAVVKALEQLAQQGKIKEKMYGKQKIYYADQVRKACAHYYLYQIPTLNQLVSTLWHPTSALLLSHNPALGFVFFSLDLYLGVSDFISESILQKKNAFLTGSSLAFFSLNGITFHPNQRLESNS